MLADGLDSHALDAWITGHWGDDAEQEEKDADADPRCEPEYWEDR